MLASFGLHFFNEAGFGAFSSFDINRAAECMEGQIRRGDTPFIVAEVYGQTAGIIAYSLDHVFTTQPIAYLHLLYVLPAYRRSPLARKLVALAAYLAKGDGACAFFATVAPTSQAARSLCNLFKRMGFQPMGGSFTRAL